MNHVRWNSFALLFVQCETHEVLLDAFFLRCDSRLQRYTSLVRSDSLMRGCGKEMKNVEKKTESLNALRLGLFLKRYYRCSSTHKGAAVR